MHNRIYFSSYLIGWMLIMACISSCQLDDPKVEVLASDVIDLTFDNDSLIADGKKNFTLRAELLDKTDPNKDVVFTTSYGAFVNGDKPGTAETTIKSSGRIAEAKLQVTTKVEDRIFVSAELGGHRVDKEIKTTPSYPEILNPFADNIALGKNGGSVVNVEVEAMKSSGKVSDGIPVQFSFIDVDTNGLVLNFKSDSFLNDEKTSVQIKSVNESVGPFEFLITVPKNEAGDTMVYRVNLKVE